MMIISVVVSPYPRPAASGPRNTSMAHSERAHNEAAQLIGFSSCQRASNAAATHTSDTARDNAEAFRSGVETCARQKTASTRFSRE